MSDEEQTAENGRFSCVSAKGCLPICNFLTSVSLHTVLSVSVALLLLWFCSRRCIGCSFSFFPSMWKSVGLHWYFWGLALPWFWYKDFFLCVFRSANEMQSSYEWECHHLRPAYIAVSVLWVRGEPNMFAGSVLRRPWGEENCWQMIVPWILSYSSLWCSVLSWVQYSLTP